MERESMSFDVVIVGAGPAGLSCAIHYAQWCKKNEKDISVCVLEKGSEVGAHVLSGAVLEPRALNELVPDWQKQEAPIYTEVKKDIFQYLTPKKSYKLPTPPQMNNHGNYIISLGNLCRWLAQYAENLGVEIYPGFAASEILYNEDKVIGVATGDLGISKSGKQKANFQKGIALLGKQVVFTEGCRGSLTEQIIKRFKLRANVANQTYGIGLKEIWEVDANTHQPGTVIHTIGWPLDQNTYGGSFIYHWENHLVSIGLVIGLDYQNPYLDPYQEFQRLKSHPSIKPLLGSGQCLSYGARALTEGGWQSIPELTFPGGVLAGCGAGFMNVPKIKGSHTAMKTGMLAAEYVFQTIHTENNPPDFTKTVKNSWVGKELKQVRNIRPGFHKGLKLGLIYAAFDTYVIRGKAPWTFKHHVDNLSFKPAKMFKPLDYPKPDGQITFDKMTSLSRANVFHEEDQPVHLKIADPKIPLELNLKVYAGPEARYCPAGVYEFVKSEGKTQFQINAQNCIHCKTCDIKDPKQNITWTTPEGGGGPNYSNM